MSANGFHPHGTDVRVHAIRTGHLVGNATFLRGEGWSSLLRRRVPYTFPAFCFILEHPEGLIAIDAGMSARARVPRHQRRFVPAPVIEPAEEVGPQMRRRGLQPEDVRLLVLTHLDWDHVGGIAHFPRAEVFLHRPEHEFATTRLGRMRFQSQHWPAGFSPTLYDLDGEPCGPFRRSRAVTARGDVRVVGLPGHSIGQVGVIVQTSGAALFFTADHTLRQDWFLEDYDAGRLLQLGVFAREHAAETSRRIHRFAAEMPTVLVPSHDSAAPQRLAAMQPVAVAAADDGPGSGATGPAATALR